MAGSRYAYVKTFELPDTLLPDTYIVCRLDGHSFHRFSSEHNFTKPNDVRALRLMDHAASCLMEEYPDIVLGFGESDEFSFLLRKSTKLYNRRQAKIVSTLTSFFTSCYVLHWPKYFPDTPLKYPPSFDGRLVIYPNERVVRDYFAWRQVDTHINNLYNTLFWALVERGGQTTTEAHATLRGTFSKDKHEMLFTRFNINYNEIDARYRKGSVLFREAIADSNAEGKTETKTESSLLNLPTADGLQQPGPSPEAESEPPSEPPAAAQRQLEVQVHESRREAPAQQGSQAGIAPVAELGGRKAEVEEQKGKGKAVVETKRRQSAKAKAKAKSATKITVMHCDIIKDDFWDARPEILEVPASSP